MLFFFFVFLHNLLHEHFFIAITKLHIEMVDSCSCCFLSFKSNFNLAFSIMEAIYNETRVLTIMSEIQELKQNTKSFSKYSYCSNKRLTNRLEFINASTTATNLSTRSLLTYESIKVQSRVNCSGDTAAYERKIIDRDQFSRQYQLHWRCPFLPSNNVPCAPQQITLCLIYRKNRLIKRFHFRVIVIALESDYEFSIKIYLISSLTRPLPAAPCPKCVLHFSLSVFFCHSFERFQRSL